MTLNQERLKEIETFNLTSGNHKSLKEGACVMELASYVAGEPWSDHPTCACPVLTRFAQRLNDNILSRTKGQERHVYSEKLKALIPKIVGTRADRETEIERLRFLAFQAVTVFLPILTDALKLEDISERLRAFKLGEWKEMEGYCREVKPRIRDADDAAAYAAAAYAAAYAAAADAAADAKRKAFWLGVRNKTWDAAIAALEQACES